MTIKAPPSPSRAEMRAARERFDLSQSEAAALIYVTVRRWQCWESGENPMHPQFWESFLQKGERLIRRNRREPPAAGAST